MYTNKAEMSMMDISRFANESKQSREYRDYIIETENYVLMKKGIIRRIGNGWFCNICIEKGEKQKLGGLIYV